MKTSVEVLLRESVKGLGLVGDVVKVAPGFARNYLYPQRLAIEANPDNKRSLARRRERAVAEQATREADLEIKAMALSKMTLTATEKADAAGSLFGSVNAAQIAVMLTSAGFPFEEKDVRLDTPIKKVGEYEVPVHLYGEKNATVNVRVEAAT